MKEDKFYRYIGTQYVNGKWISRCVHCGIELEPCNQGLINFTQMNHVPKGSKEGTLCPYWIVKSCPHCGVDIDGII